MNMMGKFEGVHRFDEKGRPAGGCTCGLGFCISWQDGPLGRGEDRDLPNGAFVETVIAAVVDRLEHYQRTEFACEYNQKAIMHLEIALEELAARTEDREERGVEGTHEV